MATQATKSALESLLFVWGEPLEAKTAAELFNMTPADTVDAFRELKDEYEQRDDGRWQMALQSEVCTLLCSRPGKCRGKRTFYRRVV